ncbi:SUKH-4 family immunity protein [Streptomyces sp. NPDC018045]|uniref:SUKH-4 family immunity protein n=1 Tax=Streptomyces sp. NPDC018045 TaxID=3365037 RepID=UPI00379DB842
MVTFAQAQERAERWVNGDVPGPFQREVRVREFDLGFVAWAEDRAGGPRTEGGRARLVIARDSGETTLWPGLPVGEVIRRYEEEYGAVADAAVAEAPPQRIDLEATSFLLTPPEWLQEAADQIGLADRRSSGATPGGGVAAASGGAAVPGAPEAVRDVVPAAGAGEASVRGRGPSVPERGPSVPDESAEATPWAGTDIRADEGADDRSVGLPETVFAPPLAGFGDEDTPPSDAWAEARTELIAGGSRLPRTAMAPAVEEPGTEEATAAEPGAGGPVAPPMPSSPPPGLPAGAVPYGGRPVPPADAAGAGATGAAVVGSDVAEPAPVGPNAAGPGAAGPAAVEVNAGGPDAAGLSELPPPSGPPIADVPPPPAYAGPPGGGSGAPGAAEGPGAPPPPLAPPSAPPSGSPGGVRAAATVPADGSALPGNAGGPPPPPGVPGAPGEDRTATGAPEGEPGPAAPPAAPAGGYVPTQLVSQLDADQVDLGAVDGPDAAAPHGEQGPPAPPAAGPGGGVHAAATMLAGGVTPPSGASGSGGPGGPGVPPPAAPPAVPSGAPGTSGGPKAPGVSGAPAASGDAGGPPPPPSAPPSAPPSGGPGGGVHAAATMLADGAGGPAAPGPGVPPPPVPGPPATGPAGQSPGAPPPAVPPPAAPPASGAYGYPQASSGQPTVGPGYMAVLSYRAPDGSEQKTVRRSAPGTPHPEWQLLHELRGMNVPPQQVLELHTELESCDLPGGYCARMIRETWPQVRISHTAAYGTEHASRQQGVRHLVAHQGELHQVADGPARPAPVRVPLPHPSQVQPVPPVPPQTFGQELEQSFGPQGIFRFDQRAVSRHGVPDVVAQTLVWAGLPVDFGPFFWAQAQPGRPVPTLAELAAERGVRPAADAGSYLVMGNDFGRQLCVQYGTAHIVAVPLEGAPGPGGQPAVPQFVNSGLPEFVRCLAMLGRMWRLRYGLSPEQAGRWTVDFQAQLMALDAPALGSPETWWSVLLEQMWDGLL